MNVELCIHGHFYQPPRENPWLDSVPLEASAAPFHDWNERIAHECYRPCTYARVLGREGRVARQVNVFEHISFDMGPTLLAWLRRHKPSVLQEIVQADARALARTGHGTAMAQVYNHVIMPLANPRDQRTQVRWGLVDFRRYYGRPAEGMWLAEAAVDVQTLELLAAEGVAFTLLAPHQAARIRPSGGPWQEVGPGGPDPRRAYRCVLPSGRSISLFFYDGSTSQAVAFAGLLESGDRFYDRIRSICDGPGQLGHIATDGESYGHHHGFGEMALAWALQRADREEGVRFTHYGAWLAANPPTWEVEIVAGSSWSCAHGVERWRSDCGCNTGGNGGWNQAWRAPLRRALDGLRDALVGPWERAAARLMTDPWEARDAWIHVVLDPTEERAAQFLLEHGRRTLNRAEGVQARELMELQRHLLLMYTSCGWFFDDLAGLEPVQLMRYAGRAVDLAERTLPSVPVVAQLLATLTEALSNEAKHGSGRDLFLALVEADRFDGVRAAAHHAAVRDVLEVDTWQAFQVLDLAEVREGSRVVRRVGVTERYTGRAWQVFTQSRVGAIEGVALLADERDLRDLPVGLGESATRVVGAEALLASDRASVASSVDCRRRERFVASVMAARDGAVGESAQKVLAWACAQSTLLDHVRSTDRKSLPAFPDALSVDPSPALLRAANLGVEELAGMARRAPDRLESLLVRLEQLERLGIAVELDAARASVFYLLDSGVDPAVFAGLVGRLEQTLQVDLCAHGLPR